MVFLRNSKENYTIQAYNPVNVWPRTISRNWKEKKKYINPYSIHKIKRKKSYIFNKSIVTQNAEPSIKSVIFLPLKVRKKQKNLTVIVNAN